MSIEPNGGRDLPKSEQITTDYEVEGSTLRVTVDRDASENYISGAVTAANEETGASDSDQITVSTIPLTGGPDTANIDLQEVGVEEGVRTDLLMTIAFEDGVQQQEVVQVEWGSPADPDIEVEISTVEEQSDGTLDVAVFVSIESTRTEQYTLIIEETATGDVYSRGGTLIGGSGSTPGDANVEDATFNVSGVSGGTVKAYISSPPTADGNQRATAEWGDTAGSISVTNCGTSQTSGDLTVTYTLAPSGGASGDTRVNIDVDGRSVASEVNFVPPRGGSFTQTIPADDLPIGTDMPVEIEVDGVFSDCGTVTVEGDDPAPEPPDDDPAPEPPDDDPTPEPGEPLVVENCDFPESVAPGDRMGAAVTITNTSNERVERDMRVEMRAGGDQIYPLWITSVSVPPASTETFNGTAEASAFVPNGEYDISVTFN